MAASPTLAGTTTLEVSATVLSTCLIAATPIALGTVSLNAIIPSSSTIVVTCSPDVPVYQLGLGTGANSTSTTTRKMKSANNDLLGYVLTKDSLFQTNWGNTANSDTVASNAAGVGGAALVKTFTVYGQVTAGQNVPAGLYTDAVAITITY